MLPGRPRPASRFGAISLLLFLFLLTLSVIPAAVSSSEAPVGGNAVDDDDLDGLDELLAIDEEFEQKGELSSSGDGGRSEADVLSRAQRIVLELSNENAKKVVDGNQYVMLLGYTPWCERSAELMPRFAEAATALKDMGSPILMTKLDAERHEKAAKLLGIKGFPTLLLFVNGTSQSYKGGFTMEEIVVWARKKTGSPVIRLSSVAAAQEFLIKHEMFIVGFFKNYEGSDYEEFIRAATSDNEIQFVETNDINVAEVLFPDIREQTHFLGLVKNEPERYLVFDEVFEEAKILNYIELNKFPLVTTLTELNSVRVYSSPIKLQVFVIVEPDDFNPLLSTFQDVARKYKTKILFVYVDSKEDNLAKPFLTLFGLESAEPIIIAFNNNIGSKYLLESELTASSLEEFCNGLLHGTLKPFFRSEPIPEKKELVEKVVGKTFDKCVLDSTVNVFLEVHTPWCMDCEATSKQVEKLAKHFKGHNDLIIARIDASLNEHPNLQVHAYPTLLFYPSGDKSNPIKLSKKSSLKDWIEAIERYMKSEEKSEDQSAKDEL